MTDKEKNMAIYRAIEKMAIEVWKEIEPKVPEGSYTAMQVHEEVIPDIRKKMEWQELTVEVEGFRCHFLNIDVFRVLHEFGKSVRVKQEEKYRFIKMEEKQVELNALVRVEKEHKVLKAMVGNDELRNVMKQLHLDAERGYLVASDCHILGAMRIDLKMNTGEVKDACFNLPTSFVDAPALMDLTKHTDHTYCYYGDKVDNSYREEEGCRYPRWYSVFPLLSEELNFRLRSEEVKRMMKFLKTVTKLPSNTYEKHQHRVSLYAESYAESVHVAYDDTDDNTHTEAVFLLERSMEHPLAICLCAERLLKLEKVWNGSLWFVDSTRPLVLDSDRENSYLLMPMMHADDDERTYYSSGLPGVKYNVAWEDRYKQTKTNTMMGYSLESLADGTYEVRGRKEKRLTEAVKQMAQYLMGKPEVQIKCQDYFARKYGRGVEANKHYTLPEQEIYDMLHGSLLDQGIELTPVQAEKPTYSSPMPYAADAPVSLKPGSTVCITGTLLHGRSYYEHEIVRRGWRFVNSMNKDVDLLVCTDDMADSSSGKFKLAMRYGTKTCTPQQFYDLLDRTPIQAEKPAEQAPEPQPAPNPEKKPAPTGHLRIVTPAPKPKAEKNPKAEKKQEELAMKIERTTTMVGRRFYPLLMLSEGDTRVIVAGNSLYEAICDDEGDIRPMYQELFDNTDAFIDDDLLTTDTLDEASICEAVTQFMDMVENAS